MKTPFLLLFVFASAFASSQVETDKPIVLTGADGERYVTGLELPLNGADATSKDYVDAAVAGSGGGGAIMNTLGSGSLPTMMSASSAAGSLNLLASVAYCRNLTEGDFTDWRYPTVEEVLYILNNDAAYATIPNVTEATYFTAWANFGPGNSGTMARFYFYLPSNDMSPNSPWDSQTYLRARCVR